MLGFVARFGSSRGMVAVPDLSTLSRSQASQALLNVGLVPQELSSVSTSNSSYDGKATSQSVTAGTLVDYGSTISYAYYTYVAPPPSGPVLVNTQRLVTAGADRTTRTCSGYTETQTTYNTYTVSYKYTYSDGTTNTVAAPSENYEVYSNSLTINNSSYCGYVSPSCMPSSYSNGCTNCSYGYRTCTTTYVQSNCSTTTGSVTYCCSSTSTSYSSWSGCACGQRYRTVTTTTTCGGSSSSSSSTQWASCTGGQIYGC